ncbi:MAG: T9SS type A sorting domain-containing protein, partial [Candidatus Kapaibacterium sp.]
DEQIVEWSSSNCLAGVNENLSNLKTSYKLSQNNLKVQVQVDKNTKLEYRVFDLNGKNISDKINYKELYLGENIFNVDLSNQSSGIYILNMITENGISNVLFNYKN